MTVVVLNKDLKETGKRFTSLAIEISAKRRGPASRISTHGRGEFGMMKGRQESTPRRQVSLYTQPLLREGR